MRHHRARTVLAALAAVTMPSWMVLQGCMDGTTPDCSLPDAGCAPSADGAVLEPDTQTPFDAGIKVDADDGATFPDTATDARLDGDARG